LRSTASVIFSALGSLKSLSMAFTAKVGVEALLSCLVGSAWNGIVVMPSVFSVAWVACAIRAPLFEKLLEIQTPGPLPWNTPTPPRNWVLRSLSRA
jgi:hypothetical protein